VLVKLCLAQFKNMKHKFSSWINDMADISCIFSAFLTFPCLLSLLVLWLSLIRLTLRFRLIILWLVRFGLDLVRLWWLWLVGLKILTILWILGRLLERILQVLLCISTLISVPFFWGSLVDRGFERIENHLVEQERGDEQELAEQEQLEEQQRVEQRVVEDQQAQY